MNLYKPRFISKPRRGRNWIPEYVRKEVYERDNYTCQYCNTQLDREELTIEHINPISKRGIDDVINYISACRSCNSSKKDKSLVEFIRSKGISVSDIPIHGDIILDTPELDNEYREVRQRVYYEMRTKGKLKGSKAFKKLERSFRQKLWRTSYGQDLSKRFPELPSYVRVSIPLVEYLVPDTRKSIYWLLVEFCKSANTRTLVDNMIRIVSNSPNTDKSVEKSIKSIIYSDHDEATQKRIDWGFKRAKVPREDDTLFDIPTDLKEIPVSERDFLLVRIAGERDKIGLTEIDDYEIRVPGTCKNQKVEIIIKKVNQNWAEGVVAKLPEDADFVL